MSKLEVFDADQRAAEREQAGLRLGGGVSPRRRRTNRIMREVRRIGRRQTELTEQAEEARQAGNHEEAERLLDEIEDGTYELIALLLDAPETGEPITAQQLAEQLDIEDASDLAARLMGVSDDKQTGGQEDSDPT